MNVIGALLLWLAAGFAFLFICGLALGITVLHIIHRFIHKEKQ